MFAGRGGLTLGVGGGSLVGNVARLASTEGATETRYLFLISIKKCLLMWFVLIFSSVYNKLQGYVPVFTSFKEGNCEF